MMRTVVEREKPAEFNSITDMLEYLRSDDMGGRSSVSVTVVINGQRQQLDFSRHMNPDGTTGGFIGNNNGATISNTHIDKSAVVYGAFEMRDSKVGANSAVLSFRYEGPVRRADANVLNGTTIGEGTLLITRGTKGFMTIRDSEIGDAVSIDLGRGAANICRAVIGSRTTVEAHVKTDLAMFDVQQAEIGPGSEVSLSAMPPRLGIINTKIDADSKVSIDKGDHDVLIAPGVKAQNDAYTVIVPDSSDAVLSKYIHDSDTHLGSTRLAPWYRDGIVVHDADPSTLKKLEDVILLGRFVYNTIRYDATLKDSYPNGRDVPLSYFIMKAGGICFEHALLLYELLERRRTDGISDARPMFVLGLADSSDSESLHAWVEVEIDGHVFVIDPTMSMPYLVAGMREKDGTFVSIMGMYGRDYMYEGRPAIAPGKAHGLRLR